MDLFYSLPLLFCCYPYCVSKRKPFHNSIFVISNNVIVGNSKTTVWLLYIFLNTRAKEPEQIENGLHENGSICIPCFSYSAAILIA